MEAKKRKLTKTEKRVISLMSVAVIVALGIFAWTNYANDYYKATDTAKKAMLGTATVEVIEEEGYYVFSKNSLVSPHLPIVTLSIKKE